MLALNAPGAPAAERRLADALRRDRRPSTGSRTSGSGCARPRSLRDLGLAEEQIPDAVEAILPQVPPGNPVPVTRDDLDHLLRRAWAGVDPR